MTEDIEFRLKNIESNIEKILNLLNGNGKIGIITQLALHDARIKEIPSPNKLKTFAAVGAGITTSFGLSCWLIYYFIRSAFTGGG